VGLENLRSIFQDELSDRVNDFVNQTTSTIFQTAPNFSSQSPIFDSLDNTSVVNFETTTNDNPAFPSNYSELNTIINGEFLQNSGDTLKNHGWFDLYQKNHKSIDIEQPTPRANNPYQRFNYGNPNVNQNLDIKVDSSKSGNRNFVISQVNSFLSNNVVNQSFNSDLVGGINQYLLESEKEPYIVSNLPTESDLGINGRATNAGSRLIPLARPIADTIRVAKYLSSPQGLLNIAAKNSNLFVSNTVVKNKKQDGLIRIPQRFNNGYNPLSTLLSTGGRLTGQGLPNVLFRSGISGRQYGDSSENDDLGFLPTPTNFINNTFTGATYDVDGVIGDGNESITGGGFKKLLGKLGINSNSKTIQPTSTGDKMTLAPMIKGIELVTGTEKTLGTQIEEMQESFNADIDDSKNGMPLYFKDLRDNSYIFFRAYIEGMTENISPSYAESSYIGRSEPVYIYERAVRTISFTLKLMAQTRSELDAIWKKINRLTSLCYPEYAKDELLSNYLSEKDDNQNVTRAVVKSRMKTPLTKFRLGEQFGKTNHELLGFIEALDYTIPDESTYETEVGSRVPKYILVTITYKVIHGEVPGLYNEAGKEYAFYGINDTKSSTDRTVTNQAQENALNSLIGD